MPEEVTADGKREVASGAKTTSERQKMKKAGKQNAFAMSHE